MNNILLDLLTFTSVLSAIFVITARSPIVAVLFLIAVFINTAGYLILLGINFIALAYIMVYIGAIAILFLFVIMMLNVRLVELTQIGSEYRKNVPLAVIIASTLSYLILSNATISKLDNVYLISAIFDKFNNWFLGINTSENFIYIGFNTVYNNIFVNYEQIQSIGNIMYSSYSLYLILCSFILLLAMLGPIIITLDKKSNTPTPHRKSDRVKLLVSLLIFSTIDFGSVDCLLSLSTIYFGNRYFSTKRLTKVQKDSFSITPELDNIIIGSSLGDLHISREDTNARLRFKQGSINNIFYIYMIYLKIIVVQA